MRLMYRFTSSRQVIRLDWSAAWISSIVASKRWNPVAGAAGRGVCATAPPKPPNRTTAITANVGFMRTKIPLRVFQGKDLICAGLILIIMGKQQEEDA